jgi:hypothetical protein
VKDDRHFASQCGGSPFDAEPLPQQAPTAKCAFRTDPRQQHSCGFEKERAQLSTTRRENLLIERRLTIADMRDYAIRTYGSHTADNSNN